MNLIDGIKALVVYTPDCLLIALLAIRPTSHWRFVSFGFYTCLTAFLLFSPSVSIGDSTQDYSNGCTIGRNFIAGCYLFWFTDPLNEFRHENDVVPPVKLSLRKRLYWTACLFYNFRGIGWNYHVKHVPPCPVQARWAFVRSTLWRVVACFIVVDVTQTYIHMNPVFSPNTAEPFSVASQGFITYHLNILVFVSELYSLIILVYSIMSVLSVAMGISEPRHWPDLIGNWAEAYTLRRFWGITWHQMCRRFLSGIGKPVARSLKLQPGSLASTSTQLLVAFVLSGLAHCGGDAMVGIHHFGRSLPFFLVQPVAIIIEDITICLAQRINFMSHSTLLARLLGFSWVVWWFSWTMPLFISWSVDLGLTRTEVVPFSVSRMILRTFITGM